MFANQYIGSVYRFMSICQYCALQPICVSLTYLTLTSLPSVWLYSYSDYRF